MELINKDIRKDFPILEKKILDKNLIYFDTAASAQKPQIVIDEQNKFYSDSYSNVSRGVHSLCVDATFKYEGARKKVKEFINARSENEIIFTKNATEAINLVAHTFFQKFMNSGDEVILSIMEHHSNLIPWYFLRDRYGIVIKFIKVDNNGELDSEHLRSLITEKTKIISITHLSNVFGTVLNQEIIKIAKDCAIPVLLDGCQSASHINVDVQKMNCDFYVFSGHKVYGPSGVGVLYGKEKLLEKLPPYLGGGGMIGEVTLDGVTFAELPAKYEAGTPPMAEVYGLGIAIDYLSALGMNEVEEYENKITSYAYKKMNSLDYVKIYGSNENRASIISFNLEGIHSHEVASFLDVEGIAVRAGHHCCQPLMNHLNVNATSRASFGIYNNFDEVDIFIEALNKCRNFFIK